MQAAERDPQRLGRQREREEREYMGQASVGTLFHELVDEDVLVAIFEQVQQPMALPDRPADGGFTPDHFEDDVAINTHARILLDDRHQGPRALKPHLEAPILEPEDQSIDSPL